MALQTVNVYVESDDVVPVPVVGVVVRFFLADDVTLVAEATSDAFGIATTTLDDVNPTYLMRFYKLGFSVTQPQSITMQPPWPLEVTVRGAVLDQHPAAPDPNYCRVSGYIRDPFGNPREGVRLKFLTIRSPAIQQTSPPALVIQPVIDIISDDDGYVVFDVYRGSVLTSQVPGWIDGVGLCEQTRNSQIVVEVPDRAWLDLTDFLLPTPASAALSDDSPVPPILVQLGNTSDQIIPTVLMSNDLWMHDNQMGYDSVLMRVSSDDESVTVPNKELIGIDTAFVVSGLALGAANITVEVINVDEFFAKRIVSPVVASLTFQVFVVV